MRGDEINMGTGSDKSKHNPDSENLKSLLKKTGKKEKKSKSVVFNETKNEFFDADYIILIREECDFDDEDDDSICTCYQHEMVRLTCCEPNCNCSVYEDFEHNPQSPKFAPPIEFVDAVTLSPPDGYKDMELSEQELMAYKQMARRGQRTAVCKECSATHEHNREKDGDLPTNGESKMPSVDLNDADYDSEKIDQSQQTTPTSPNNTDDQQFILDSAENEKCPEENSHNFPTGGSPVTGILKGGRLWRQQIGENNCLKNELLTKSDSISDDEGMVPRSVRFIEGTDEKKDSCKSSPENERQVEGIESRHTDDENSEDTIGGHSPELTEPTEMMITFKLGNHVLISNNSLKPNSAVRQLFPCTKNLTTKEDPNEQYLVTAESLRAFEEAKRSKLPQIIQNAGTNESIKRVIERNTLRRSLVRYEPRSKKNMQKTDNSLVERIKLLTCDIDEVSQESEDLPVRVSPTGEEGHNPVEINQVNKYKERNFSPSSSSTASSSSSSMSSTYRKITDLFGKREKPDNLPNAASEPKTAQTQTLPDIGGPYNQELEKANVTKPNMSYENKKQFLSTLVPLTACVSNIGNPDDHYYQLSKHGSIASSTGSEYTLDDIEEGLQNDDKKITPDVLAGTPASESGDELAVFVQQDANRIERIKRSEYESDQSPKRDEDDEHDDYGFNRRPSVRGIKPRFGSTTEILQQIQNQIQVQPPSSNAEWPYYSESGLNREADESNRTNTKPNLPPPYSNIPEDAKIRGYIHHYRPDSLYQNCGNETCYKEVYKTQSSVIEVDCNNYQTMPKIRNGRPLSPPPQEMSKTYHQTMVYIPYNHIEGYQPVVIPNAYQTNEYYRYNQNQINKQYIDPYYQQKLPHSDDQFCNSNIPPVHKLVNKNPYPNNYQPLLVPSSRSESPLGNFSMARSTQTSVACVSSCNYYQGAAPQMRYREPLRQPWKAEYVNKASRNTFPLIRPRYNLQDNTEKYLDDPNSQHNGQPMNAYYNYLPSKESPVNSPTKARFIERGVPEGAASVSPQDSVNLQSTNSTTTSPIMTQTNTKPLFYAMNV